MPFHCFHKGSQIGQMTACGECNHKQSPSHYNCLQSYAPQRPTGSFYKNNEMILADWLATTLALTPSTTSPHEHRPLVDGVARRGHKKKAVQPRHQHRPGCPSSWAPATLCIVPRASGTGYSIYATHICLQMAKAKGVP